MFKFSFLVKSGFVASSLVSTAVGGYLLKNRVVSKKNKIEKEKNLEVEQPIPELKNDVEEEEVPLPLEPIHDIIF